MKLKRQTTNQRVNELLSKEEPTFGFMELSQAELNLALNWYNQFKEKEVSYKYLTEYCKSQGIKASAKQIEQQVATVGFVCRMLSRGAILDNKSMAWLSKHLKSMSGTLVEEKVDTDKPIGKPAKPVTIQDRLKEKSRESIGWLEGAVDSLILSDFKKVPNTLQLMREKGVQALQGPSIVNHFKRCRDEFRLAIAGTDEQVNEGYSNYTEPQMKKMEALYDQIISDTLTVMGELNADKAPRKKRTRTPEQQVKSFKFCTEDKAMKLKSVPATRMIGSEGLWTYHRGNRMLTFYAADNADGLGAKGCAILNYSKQKSRAKKLRKPEEILPQVLSSGKVALKNLFDGLTTKDAKVTGRVNKETLLVRVIA